MRIIQKENKKWVNEKLSIKYIVIYIYFYEESKSIVMINVQCTCLTKYILPKTDIENKHFENVSRIISSIDVIMNCL